jgi:hypothetical protein
MSFEGVPANTAIPGSPLMWDGTGYYWYNPIKDIYIEDDFVTNAATSSYSWASTISGTGAAISRQNSVLSDTNHPGVLVYATGTTTTGNLCIQLQQNNGQGPLTFGGGQIDIFWIFNIPTLSTATDTYTIRLGFGDQPSADMVAGAYFSYTDAATGAAWVINTAQNSTRTQTTTNTVVTTGWHTAHIQVNAAASSVVFQMDGVTMNVSPLSTNIPTGTANTQKCGPIFQMLKSAGTTSIGLVIDKVFMFQKITTSR